MAKGTIGRIVEQIVIFIIIQIITTFAISFLTQESGRLFISKSFSNNSSYYSTLIEVKNYKENRSIENFKVIFKSEIKVDSIESTNGVIDDVNNVVEFKYLPPQATATIVTHSLNPISKSDIILDTADKIVVRDSDSERVGFFVYIIYILVNVVFYSAMTIIVFVSNKKRIDKLEKRQEDLENEQRNFEEIVRSNKLEISEMRLKLVRFKVLHISKISDYRKELEFWRDTIRKMMYNKSNKMDIESLISHITDSLKTYGTKNRIDVYSDELMHLAKRLAQKEKVQDQDEFAES